MIFKFCIIIFIIIILILCKEWNCRPNYNIKNRSCNFKNEITKNGLFYQENIFTDEYHNELKNKYLKNYNTNTIEIDINDTFLNKDYFLNYLRKITKQPNLKLVNKNDKRQAWLRYFNTNIKNFYEYFHIDRKRYNCNAFQYRVVYCIHNDSDASFISLQPDCKDIEIPTKENCLVIIEAENLVHRVKFNKGTRLMLMADYTTDLNRGIHGNLTFIWDSLWFKIQKFLTKIN